MVWLLLLCDPFFDWTMIVERMAKWLSHFRSSEPVSSCPSCPNFLDRPLKVSRTSRQTGRPMIGNSTFLNSLEQSLNCDQNQGLSKFYIDPRRVCENCQEWILDHMGKKSKTEKKKHTSLEKKSNLGNFCSLQVSALFSRLQHASLKNSKQICTRALIFGWLARVEGWLGWVTI